MNKHYIDQDIYFIENFIPKEELEIFAKDFNDQDGWYRQGNFYIKDKTTVETSALLDRYHLMVEGLISDRYNKVNWNNNLQKYKVTEGNWAIAPHADRFNAEGVDYASNTSQYVTKGYILYFNDDYEGGEVVYTKKEYRIRPKAGMILVHSGFEDYEHAVTPVESGERHILSGFVYESDYFYDIMTNTNR
jgi:hypothetical protein